MDFQLNNQLKPLIPSGPFFLLCIGDHCAHAETCLDEENSFIQNNGVPNHTHRDRPLFYVTQPKGPDWHRLYAYGSRKPLMFETPELATEVIVRDENATGGEYTYAIVYPGMPLHKHLFEQALLRN
ncbi:hypothetical protein DV711_06225 [Motiliproteus coralliicola]|uniref:Uncharacterized protein n=1 Tax=Motiliproteus coralliicola TaxID=2283196 RepID=A0A369WVT2_9GAMM|nr:hypothetical protein [Motiliproteus coralliicola]RDE25149.1 hypothetical protein DV711_06225 [Motiliproteus coralliicola]